jgi:hypothetical protein
VSRSVSVDVVAGFSTLGARRCFNVIEASLIAFYYDAPARSPPDLGAMFGDKRQDPP